MNRSVVQILGLSGAIRWYFHHHRIERVNVPLAVEAVKAVDRGAGVFEYAGRVYGVGETIKRLKLEPFVLGGEG